jgi:hypothetical protein
LPENKRAYTISMIVTDPKILQILRDGGKIHREIIDELFQTGLLTE